MRCWVKGNKIVAAAAGHCNSVQLLEVDGNKEVPTKLTKGKTDFHCFLDLRAQYYCI